MAKTDYQSIDEYIAAQPPVAREALEAVRATIHAAVPGAEEVVSYQIPAMKHHGWLFYFGAFAKHFSLSCPPPFTVFDEFADRLASYKRSKSAIQFPYDRGVPTDLIADMARFRARENVEREQAKQPAKKP